MTGKPRIQDILPVSSFQEGMLFHSQFDLAGADVYMVQWVFDLQGALDAAGLRRASEALLRRHPNLRAAFRHRATGEPIQIIPTETALPWREVDLSHLDREAGIDEADRVLHQEYTTRFAPARPPLLRFTLIRLAPDLHRLALTNHHLILDGWSIPLLMRELFALALFGVDESALPPPIPYRNYYAHLESRDHEVGRKTWSAVLAGLDGPTRVAGSAAHEASARPIRLAAELSAEETTELVRQVRGHGLTLNTAIQGAWGIVLSRLTGRDDLMFGATVSGRPPALDGAESMIGMFINTIPVRMRVDPAEPLFAALQRLQDEQAQLLDHQHFGLSELHRLAGVTEFFDTCVVFENYPLDPDSAELSGTGLSLVAVDVKDAAHYPMRLVVVPGERLRLWLDYRPDAVDARLAEQVLGWLRRLVRAVATDPELAVGRLELLDAAERHKVLTEWNDTAHAVPDATLVSLFEEQVRRSPEAVAVAFE
uniref:condensation domain-containing protein n=1 Tax=Catenulispora pinisilvae TaxID=2705253 RepID=UPI002B272282